MNVYVYFLFLERLSGYCLEIDNNKSRLDFKVYL
jgi:hypothetical protein